MLCYDSTHLGYWEFDLRSMGKKRDIQQIEAIAKEFHLTREQRAEFGNFIEQEKAGGWRGSLNDRGDFTYAELRQKAQEFKKLIN